MSGTSEIDSIVIDVDTDEQAQSIGNGPEAFKKDKSQSKDDKSFSKDASELNKVDDDSKSAEEEKQGNSDSDDASISDDVEDGKPSAKEAKQGKSDDASESDKVDDSNATKEEKKGKKRKNTSEQQNPKAKKLRVKPEKVQEVSEKMTEELAKHYVLGNHEMSMDLLAHNVGYKHPRSDAILGAMKLLKANGIAEKSKDTCKLTEKGIKEFVSEATAPADPEEAKEQMWNLLVSKLECMKHGKGDKVRAAAENIWNLIQDGKPHPIDDVLKVTTYSMERSTGFPDILRAFKELGLAEKQNKKLQATDKLLHPFGKR